MVRTTTTTTNTTHTTHTSHTTHVHTTNNKQKHTAHHITQHNTAFPSCVPLSPSSSFNPIFQKFVLSFFPFSPSSGASSLIFQFPSCSPSNGSWTHPPLPLHKNCFHSEVSNFPSLPVVLSIGSFTFHPSGTSKGQCLRLRQRVTLVLVATHNQGSKWWIDETVLRALMKAEMMWTTSLELRSVWTLALCATNVNRDSGERCWELVDDLRHSHPFFSTRMSLSVCSSSD